MEKKGRVGERKGFCVKMIGNGEEMRGDQRDLVMEFRERKWGQRERVCQEVEEEMRESKEAPRSKTQTAAHSRPPQTVRDVC